MRRAGFALPVDTKYADTAGVDELQSPLSPTGSSYDFAQPHQTIVFLDWDDTLFPTSQLFGADAWNLPSKPEEWKWLSLTQLQESMLEEWQDALYKYLLRASFASDAVVILTNSRRPWVDTCLEQFAGNISSVIRHIPGLKVIYAREFLTRAATVDCASPVRQALRDPDEDEEKHHQIMREAKFQAMKKEVRRFYSRNRMQTWKNIISIGDAHYERDAAQDLALRRQSPRRERLRLKTIITPAEPSIISLSSRLKLGSAVGLARLAELDDDLDIDMNTTRGMQDLAVKLKVSWNLLKQMLRPANDASFLMTGDWHKPCGGMC